MPITPDQFVHDNEQYVANRTLELQQQPEVARQGILIIACMDARLDPLGALGWEVGDAYVVRNAGGRASEGLRSVIVSQQAFASPITKVIVMHHTDCGMHQDAVQPDSIRDDDLREFIKRNPPKPPTTPIVSAAVDSTAFLFFSDPLQAIVDDVLFLRDHPLVAKDTGLRGYIVNIHSGRLETQVDRDGSITELCDDSHPSLPVKPPNSVGRASGNA